MDRKRVKKLTKHPLFIAVIVAIISISGTHYYDLQTIQYEKSLEESLVVDFLGQHEFNALPDTAYRFSEIFIYNPSPKTVSIKQVLMYTPNEWSESSQEKQEEPNVNIPSLDIVEQPNPEFQPYMEIDSGKIEKIKGVFFLETPSKEDDYYIKFCAITYDNKQFCTKDSLIIHVNPNQPLI
jgi:hypothetical protein